MSTPRRRRPKPYQRRALTLLAGCGDAGEEVMCAHGFTAEQLAELVRDGFVTKTRERVVGTEEPFDIVRFKLADQHALGD
jgi:hypothetical protein